MSKKDNCLSQSVINIFRIQKLYILVRGKRIGWSVKLHLIKSFFMVLRKPADYFLNNCCIFSTITRASMYYVTIFEYYHYILNMVGGILFSKECLDLCFGYFQNSLGLYHYFVELNENSQTFS